MRDEAQPTLREFATSEIGRDYLLALDPALELVSWRNTAVELAHATAIGSIWTDLAEHKRIDIEVKDAASFLQAAEERAAPYTDAGRQPVLLVRGRSDPEWIEVWLDGERPAGMQVAIKGRHRQRSLSGHGQRH